jgi:hypothetical protein
MCRVRGMPWMFRTCLCGLPGLRLCGSRRGPRRAVARHGSLRLRGPGRIDHGQCLLGRGLHDLRLRLTVRASVTRFRQP